MTKAQEDKLHEVITKVSNRLDEVDAELLKYETSSPTLIDKLKAWAFPTLVVLNGIFFMAMYENIKQIPTIKANVDVLMHLSKLTNNTKSNPGTLVDLNPYNKDMISIKQTSLKSNKHYEKR